METVYQIHGYESRKDYLINLSEEYNMPQRDVFTLAGLLGPNEDFDGLINALEDYKDKFGME